MEEFKKEFIGRKVRFIDEEAHEDCPDYFPPVGSIGTIVDASEEGKDDWAVQWDEDSGVDEEGALDRGLPYTWFCAEESIELVEEERLMADEEVWEMLEPKMEKNRIFGYRLWGETVYAPEDTQKAVALAYKMGYERAMRGRPFKYAEKENVKNED